MSGNPERPYELVPSEVLIEELERRFDGLVVVTTEDRNGQDHLAVMYHGGFAQALGMLTLAAEDMRRDWNSIQETERGNHEF